VAGRHGFRGGLGAKPCPERGLGEREGSGCTISGHGLVDGVHSIEKTEVRGGDFSLTEAAERVKTYSFFDSFLGFSGWCGVRGPSEITVLAARRGQRASEGL